VIYYAHGHRGFIVLLLWLLQKFGDLTSARRPTRAFELNNDEDEDDYESMKSDNSHSKKRKRGRSSSKTPDSTAKV
jgi:hypothetical protein